MNWNKLLKHAGTESGLEQARPVDLENAVPDSSQFETRDRINDLADSPHTSFEIPLPLPAISGSPTFYQKYGPKPATWQEELAGRFVPLAGPPCDRTEHFNLLHVDPPDSTSHFYRFHIQEPDGAEHQFIGLDRTCVFSILRGLERAYRHGAKAGGEWSWLDFLRKVVGNPLGLETPSPAAQSQESGTSESTSTTRACSNTHDDDLYNALNTINPLFGKPLRPGVKK